MSAISLINIPASTSSSGQVKASPEYFKERRAEVQQLNDALKSGDLASAQQDYNNLVTLGKNGLNRDNPFLRSDRGQDFDAIGGAIENGDLKGAQQALAQLESSFKQPPAAASGATGGVNVIA
jgi:hypothetical protein